MSLPGEGRSPSRRRQTREAPPLPPLAGGREPYGRVTALDVVQVPEVFGEEDGVVVAVGGHLALVVVLQFAQGGGVV